MPAGLRPMMDKEFDTYIVNHHQKDCLEIYEALS